MKDMNDKILWAVFAIVLVVLLIDIVRQHRIIRRLTRDHQQMLIDKLFEEN